MTGMFLENTLKAMKIDKARVAREAKFWENRKKGKKLKEIKGETREQYQNISLVQAPASLLKESTSTAGKIKVQVLKPKTEEHNPLESD